MIFAARNACGLITVRVASVMTFAIPAKYLRTSRASTMVIAPSPLTSPQLYAGNVLAEFTDAIVKTDSEIAVISRMDSSFFFMERGSSLIKNIFSV